MGMFDFLKGGKGSSQSVLGIDIGSSSIKIVQLGKKKGKAVLETYGELALGPYAQTEIGRATNLPTDKVAEALKDLLREANAASRVGGIAIPFGASLMSLMELPDASAKDLKQMVPIEARKYIPVPISEIMLDWWVVPKFDERDFGVEDEGEAKRAKKIEVLAVAIHNDTINRYQEIVQKSGLDVRFFEIEVFSTIRSVIEEDIKPVMIFDMGAASSKLYIVERGVIRNSHTINRGSQDMTMALSKSLGINITNAEIVKRNYGASSPAEAKQIRDIVSLTLDYVFTEANRVLLNYQKKYGKSIAQVLLVGGGVKLKDFVEMSRLHFQTEVAMANPFEKIETPAFLEDVLKTTGPEFAVAIGVALRMLQETP